MASFYTKDQLDVLAQVVGNRIKNSVTDIRIANELEKSSEHKLITKSYKQSIDALISGSTADPEKNYTAAENIISFIDALDNGYVAITPEIPSDTEEPLEIEVGPNTTEGEETFRFRSRVSPDYVDPHTEAAVFLSLSVQPEGVWEVKDPITNEIIANSEGVLLPHVDLSPITPDSPVDLVFYHKTEAELNFSVSGDIDSLTLGSLGGINNSGMEVYALDLPSDPDGSPGIIEVQAFSKHISFYNFSVDWNLKVPRRLPKHITTLAGMFQQTKRFNQDISTWNTINITDMSNMFYNALAFNSPLNDWNTSNVTTMESMFSSAENFNQHIYKWDVSNVTNMNSMFEWANNFNKPLRFWDVSKVGSFTSMFSEARKFNQDLSLWDVARISTKPNRFDLGAESWVKEKPVWGEVVIRPEIDDTDYSDPVKNIKPEYTVKTIDRTQASTLKFNTYNTLDFEELRLNVRVEDIVGDWTLMKNGEVYLTQNSPSTVTPRVEIDTENNILDFRSHGDSDTASYEFIGTADRVNISYEPTTTAVDLIVEGSLQIESYSSTIKSQTLNLPNIELTVPSDIPETITDLTSAFYNCTMFNQDISGWDVSNVTSMNSTFSNCVEFDQPIGSWNIGKVGTSSELPGAYAMESIFDNVVKFSQDLSQWCTAYIEYMPNNFGGNLRNDQYPVWGTCPRNEVPVPIRYFEFETESTDTVFGGELILKLTVPPETTWTLVRINPETKEENILSTSVENSTGIIPIGGSSETYNSYRFEGEASKLIMEFEHNIVDGHNQRGSVDVTRMSDYIASYEFKLNILSLWMPAKLPKCVTSTSNMFAGINKFNSNPVGDWDVSNVTDMSYMFYACNEFTGGGMYSSMPSWDVSKVTNMEGMFSHAYKFKLDLSNWCVSNITTEPTDFALNAPLLTENKKPIWGTCPYRTPEEFWNLNENPRVFLNSSSNLTPSNLNCNFKFQINGDVYNEDLSLDITDTGPWSDRVSVFRDETTGLLGFSANQSEWLEIILTIPENMRQYYNQFDLGTGIIAEDGRIYFIIYAT